MKKLAIGILAAAGIAMSMPASAQGVYVGAGPGGVGVGVGTDYSYNRGYYGRVIAATPMTTATAIAAPTAARCGRSITGMSGTFAAAGSSSVNRS